MGSALAQRVIVPEQLDHLAASDPKAIGSRRDLVWINGLMFQAGIMARALRPVFGDQRALRVLEIGTGDGAFIASVLGRLGRQSGELVLLDQLDLVEEERRAQLRALGWTVEIATADVLEWLERDDIGRFDVVCANLFLHHFSDDQLRGMFARFGQIAPVFVATEPHRNGLALAATRLLGAIGANSVTRHDAAASVRAGFAGDELTRLWPLGAQVEERRVGPFTQLFSVRGGEAGDGI